MTRRGRDVGRRLSAAQAAAIMATAETAHYPGSMTDMPARLPLRHCPALAAATMIVLLAGCGHAPPRASAPPPVRPWNVVPPADPAMANAVLMRALGLVGTPYRYGGNTPASGFDCSGLIAYVYREMARLPLPRTTRELARLEGPKIAPARLAAGDLVFFGDHKTVSHVGIYVGQGRFVHAPSSGGTVRLDSLDGPYWRDHYRGAKRVLN